MRTKRLLIKGVLSLIGMIILLIIAFQLWSAVQIEAPIGEYITVEEVINMAEAVGEYTGETEGLQDYLAKTDLFEEQEWDSQEFLTYGQFLVLITYFEYEEMELKGKYKEEHNLLKADWYEFFDFLIIELECSETIVEMELEIWGIGGSVQSELGLELEANQTLTSGGIFQWDTQMLPLVAFYKVKVVVADHRIIAIKEVMVDEIVLKNIWIMEVLEEDVLCFYEGYEITFPKTNGVDAEREQIADLLFQSCQLQQILIKSEKQSGKLLSINDDVLEIEGVGSYPLAEDVKVYKLYGTMELYEISELRIGYDFTDYIIEDNEIVACLVARDEYMEYIRVLLKTTGFTESVHESVSFYGDVDLQIKAGDATFLIPAGEVVTIDQNSEYFVDTRIVITPVALTGLISIPSIQRSQGTPSYRGALELVSREDGIVVINELLLEEYLYAVVPSEMPASYPKEALKSQAICARTYAYGKMLYSGLPSMGAHVDDSVSFQVYQNISENVETTKAVKETSGIILYYEDEVVTTYYYSTSCGYGTNVDVWNPGNASNYPYLQSNHIGVDDDTTLPPSSLVEEDVFASYILSVNENDYEKEEGWYRWEYEVQELDLEHFIEVLESRYQVNSSKILTLNEDGEYESRELGELGLLQDITVEKRNEGGVVEELLLIFEKNTIKVISELNVRYILCDGVTLVNRQDQVQVEMSSLLPSGYFIIDTVKNSQEVVGYQINGGGYGHGVGMSQNGARAMADVGLDDESILSIFYQDSYLVELY